VRISKIVSEMSTKLENKEKVIKRIEFEIIYSKATTGEQNIAIHENDSTIAEKIRLKRLKIKLFTGKILQSNQR